MMVGITAHAAYIPRYRIEREKIASAHRLPAIPGERAAVNYDEDSLTMAAAAVHSIVSTTACGGIYFSSTSPPHLERMNASIIAAACDLCEGTAVADYSGSLRSGTVALGSALDRASAQGGDGIVVVAADVREAAPESPEEQMFGDGAAAVSIGSESVIAECKGRVSVYADFLDAVRRDKDAQVTSFASKFTFEHGYLESVSKVIAQLLQKCDCSPGDISRLVLPPVDQKSHMKVATRAGFKTEQIQPSLFEQVGLTGSAAPLLLLSAALETARPGDKILVVGYGEGADAFLFEATEYLSEYRVARPIERQLARGLRYPSYQAFRKARDFFRHSDEGPYISNILYEKDEPQITRLRGTECRECGTRQFPKTRVCITCRNTKSLEDVHLSREGRLFTYTTDSLYSSPAPPTVMAVVDLEGGGRMFVQMTDVDPEEVRIDMPVHLAFRRLGEGSGLHHYYWKGVLEEG